MPCCSSSDRWYASGIVKVVVQVVLDTPFEPPRVDALNEGGNACVFATNDDDAQ